MIKADKAKAKTEAKGLRKYLGLILLVVLFLVLTVGMLLSNVYVTTRLAKDSEVVVATERQARLAQQLAKDIMDINLYLDESIHRLLDVTGENSPTNTDAVSRDSLPQEALYLIEDIRRVRMQFDETLGVLEQGGILRHEEKELNIDRLVYAEAELKEVRGIWNPYLGLLDNFFAEYDQGLLRRRTAEYLVDYTRLYEQMISAKAIEVNNLALADINRKSDQWRLVQAGGIAVAFLLFAMIVFGALRQLVKNDQRLSIANQEMSEIMSAVNDGLFLVDKDLRIGGQYSDRVEEIIGQRDLGDKNLLDVLGQLVSQEDVETTKVFVDQLYSEWVVEDLIEDLNPLHRVCVTLEADGVPVTKYLDFRFFRVFLDGKIERILVSVSDMTESVRLQASLEMQKEQEQRELEMLNTILNANPVVMGNFIRDSLGRLNEINQALKTTPSSDQKELRGKIQYIARLIHSIKGEASSMKLNRMVSICENFEEMIAHMRKIQLLSGQDFLALVVLLEDLYRLFDILENYAARVGVDGKADEQHSLAGFADEASVKSESATVVAAEGRDELASAAEFEGYFRQFVQDIAQRSGKQARLICNGLASVRLNHAQQSGLKEIIIQLLRNAVVHGIEVPEVRRQAGKAEAGLLQLNLKAVDGNLYLEVEDDGNGIDFEAIRSKAVRNQLVSEADAAGLDRRQLLRFMFSSGFSTAQRYSEDAGRGVGMDIVKNAVQGLGGKLSVASEPGTYTRFSFKLPQA